MRFIRTAVAAAVLGLALSSTAQAGDKGFEVAITVDDLPSHGSVPPGVSRIDVARDYLAGLTAHKVPQVYGFVNAIGVQKDPATLEALKMWRAAGYPLGNHTFSHMNITSGTLEAFEADLEAGEPVIRDLMGDQDWRVLRFPYLSAAGNNPAIHAGIMAYLKDHHYRIADVSMGYSDWAYTDTYARCMAKGDTAAVEAMKVQYMNGVAVSIKRGLALSQKVYGRRIPFVVLMHEGAFSALMLPKVLDVYEAAGARFISLDQAQSDPAYAETDAKAGEGDLIVRTAQAKGINLWGGDIPADVDVSNLDKMCR